MEYRATIRGKIVMLQVGADGCLWTWQIGKGQVVLASSSEAYEFALAYVDPKELSSLLPKLKRNSASDVRPRDSMPVKRKSPGYGSDVGLGMDAMETHDA